MRARNVVAALSCLAFGVLSAEAAAAPGWIRLTPPTLDGTAARAYDPATNRLYLFPKNYTPMHQVWTRRVEAGANWERVDCTTRGVGLPGSMRAAITDPPGKRIIVLAAGTAGGGLSLAGSARLAATALSLGSDPQWIALTDPDDPAPGDRADFALVHDSRRDRLLLIGGITDLTLVRSDVWALPLTDAHPRWTRLDGLDLPEIRTYPAAAYDSIGDRVILFGGVAEDNEGRFPPTNDLLELDFSGTPHWARISAAGSAPPATVQASAVELPGSSRLVVTGGTTAPGDLWALDLGATPTWQPLGRGPDPVDARDAYATPVAGSVLLLGRPLETWRVDLGASARWSLLDAPFRAGPDLNPRVLLVDPVSGSFLATCEMDVERIDHQNTVVHAMDVWRLTPGLPPRWEALTDVGQPPPAMAYVLPVYDSHRLRWILFGLGGLFPDSSLGVQAWALDLVPHARWHHLVPEGEAPASIPGAAGAYDPLRDRILFFGGGKSEGSMDFVALELGDRPRWVSLAPPARVPIPRNSASMIFDPARDRFLLFGGQSTTRTPFGEPKIRGYNDLWEIDHRDSLSCFPPDRFGIDPARQYSAYAFLDPARDEMGLIDGAHVGFNADDRIGGDLRRLTLTSPLTWEDFFAPSLAAPPLTGFNYGFSYGMPPSVSFDTAHDRLLVLWDKQLWSLDRGQPTHEVLVDLVPGDPTNMLRADGHGLVTAAILGSPAFDASSVDPASVTLAGAPAQVANAADRASLRDVNHDGFADRVLRFARADMALEPAVDVVALKGRTRTGEAVVGWALYRLGEGNGAAGRGIDADGLAAEGDPDAPFDGSTRLALAVPGPVRGAASVRLAVPVTAAGGNGGGVLEVYSVDGRRVARHELGALAPGTHAIALEETRGLASGVYFARVRLAGGQAAAARFVVLR